MSTERPSSRRTQAGGSGSRFGPVRLAKFATRRPRRVLAAWGVVLVVSMGLAGALLGTGLTSDSSLTNNPDSTRAQDLIDARLSHQNEIDEVIVVRSERSVVSVPSSPRGSARSSQRCVAAATSRRSPATWTGATSAWCRPTGTPLPVVLAGPKDERIAGLVATVERANGSQGFAAHITGGETLDRDLHRAARERPEQG